MTSELTSAMILAGVFAGLMMLSSGFGSLLAGWAYRDAAKDRTDLRHERQMLADENKRLNLEVLELKGQVIALEARLTVAIDQIADLSSRISSAAPPEQ